MLSVMNSLFSLVPYSCYSQAIYRKFNNYILLLESVDFIKDCFRMFCKHGPAQKTWKIHKVLGKVAHKKPATYLPIV